MMAQQSTTREQTSPVSFNATVSDWGAGGTIQFRGASEDFRLLLFAITLVAFLLCLTK